MTATHPVAPRQPRKGPEFRLIPENPPDELTVVMWADPVVARVGIAPDDVYVEQFWTPVLGPSGVLLLRRLARQLESEPAGFVARPNELAQDLGIGNRAGRNSPFWRAVGRSHRFGLTQLVGERFAVRTKISPLTARQVSKLPPHLQKAHDEWAGSHLHGAPHVAGPVPPHMPPHM